MIQIPHVEQCLGMCLQLFSSAAPVHLDLVLPIALRLLCATTFCALAALEVSFFSSHIAEHAPIYHLDAVRLLPTRSCLEASTNDESFALVVFRVDLLFVEFFYFTSFLTLGDVLVQKNGTKNLSCC